ncbi:hypothetical protein [Pseudaminobacter soli (ex Li et al. 2025)]|uniref:Uncharacterized protein n=1 Tax=Pseudaminobacter soli (ex Li et al. 2025) TaxID=1295366 RepID=A0A2P7RJY2_9HYPH|nr:hypothetical protein [Mesorhizobium soli]PSJ50522.1 hypothetical protein C7I85_30030 [Mesorhizobium soli]
MARQYVITEEEMMSLIEGLELRKLRDGNVCDPFRHMDDAWRNLSDKEKQNMQPAVESLHKGFHYVVVRWAQKMGFDGYRK